MAVLEQLHRGKITKFGTATNVISDTPKNLICDKPHKATNVIYNKHNKAINIISSKHHMATNGISDLSNKRHKQHCRLYQTMTFVVNDICHLRKFVAYDVCRIIMFVGYDVCHLIKFFAYDVCRIMTFVVYDVSSTMMFVANYNVCRLLGLSQYPKLCSNIFTKFFLINHPYLLCNTQYSI